MQLLETRPRIAGDRPPTLDPIEVTDDVVFSPPGTLDIIHLSFEGPDRYAHAGGLAVRVDTMARSLAGLGHRVDLYFVGEPTAPTVETVDGVTLHRWSQTLSATAPGGVYDGEEAKIADWCTSLPAHLAAVVAGNARRGRATVVLAEDWHTAWPLICLHEELERRGLRDRVVLAWTANNRFGFERIDFDRLDRAATILTISRAMKHLMWGHGVNPRVVPNGLDPGWLEIGDDGGARKLRQAAGGRLLLAKVGRWDPDKRWPMAVEAVADLVARGRPALLLARGWNGCPSASSHGSELRALAARHRLDWVVIDEAGPGGADLAEALAAAPVDDNAVVELAFPVAGAALHSLYRGADAVLANSGFEPFGLVGLEAMAAGGIVVTGSTGEDYVRPYRNGFALDTDDPSEIVDCLTWLERDGRRSRAMRSCARRTAREYGWPDVLERLLLALGLG
ncbi:MAG: glycosyltransferase family 4 protein [Acidimicrobiales bacterium]